jgi:hypothetical protein
MSLRHVQLLVQTFLAMNLQPRLNFRKLRLCIGAPTLRCLQRTLAVSANALTRSGFFAFNDASAEADITFFARYHGANSLGQIQIKSIIGNTLSGFPDFPGMFEVFGQQVELDTRFLVPGIHAFADGPGRIERFTSLFPFAIRLPLRLFGVCPFLFC